MSIIFKKATALWLVENTSLTFKQIAEFCQLSLIEVQTMADGQYENKMVLNPIESEELTTEEIKRCEQDENAVLQSIQRKKHKLKTDATRSPSNSNMSAIKWLLKNHSQLSSLDVAKLSQSSEDIVDAIKQRGNKPIPQLLAKSPVTLGLCTKEELEKVTKKQNDAEK